MKSFPSSHKTLKTALSLLGHYMGDRQDSPCFYIQFLPLCENMWVGREAAFLLNHDSNWDKHKSCWLFYVLSTERNRHFGYWILYWWTNPEKQPPGNISPRFTDGQVLRLRCLFAVTGEIVHLSSHHTYAKHLKSFHLFQPVILNFPSTFPTSLSVTCKVPDSVFTGLITQVVSTLFSCFAKRKVFIAVKYCSF